MINEYKQINKWIMNIRINKQMNKWKNEEMKKCRNE